MSRLTGNVCVEQRKTGPAVWVAKYDRVSGTPTRKVLGPAWVKPTKRRTARGTTMWRSPDGPKPDGYLTPRDAAARLQELLEEERRRPVPEPPRVADKTLADGAEAWLLHCEVVRELAPSTLRHYRSTVHAHLFPSFGPDTLLSSITTASIDNYTLRLLIVDGISRSVVTQILGALRGILKRASKQGWIAHNPALEAESITPPRPSGDFNVLSPEQVEAVARTAESDWERVRRGRAGKSHGRGATAITDQHANLLDEHRRALALLAGAAIRLSAQTGLRLGELRALRWKDVDWSNGVVHVRRNAPTSAPAARAEKAPKPGRVRSVPMTDDTIRILDELSRRDRFTGPEDYVFPSPTGERLDGNDLRNAFYAALDRADLGHLRRKEDPIVWHDLRHTFGTMAVRVAPVTDVKEWMGHAHLSTTMRYVHYIPRHDAGKLLTQAFARDRVLTDRDAGARA